jgi:hypothetical protein
MKRKIKVRLAHPAGRSIQVRYKDPDTGVEIRLNTYTDDETEAANLRDEVEAKLRLGIKVTTLREPQKPTGPQMRWQEFREAFTDHLTEEKRKGNLRDSSIGHAESRLEVAEKILHPRTLGEFVAGLNRLQEKMLAGAESRGNERLPRGLRGLRGVVVGVEWLTIHLSAKRLGVSPLARPNPGGRLFTPLIIRGRSAGVKPCKPR